MKSVCTCTVSDPVIKVEEYKASDNGEYQQEERQPKSWSDRSAQF